jgi:hypothetical protein
VKLTIVWETIELTQVELWTHRNKKCLNYHQYQIRKVKRMIDISTNITNNLEMIIKIKFHKCCFFIGGNCKVRLYFMVFNDTFNNISDIS